VPGAALGGIIILPRMHSIVVKSSKVEMAPPTHALTCIHTDLRGFVVPDGECAGTTADHAAANHTLWLKREREEEKALRAVAHRAEKLAQLLTAQERSGHVTESPAASSASASKWAKLRRIQERKEAAEAAAAARAEKDAKAQAAQEALKAAAVELGLFDAATPPPPPTSRLTGTVVTGARAKQPTVAGRYRIPKKDPKD